MIVFDHAQRRGLYLHFKLQETEIDDNRHGKDDQPVPTSLDGGRLGVERKLYCRELVARFRHELALNWNLAWCTSREEARPSWISTTPKGPFTCSGSIRAASAN